MCDLSTILGQENIAYLPELDRKRFRLVTNMVYQELPQEF